MGKPLLILITLSNSQLQNLIQHLGWGEIYTVSQVNASRCNRIHSKRLTTRADWSEQNESGVKKRTRLPCVKWIQMWRCSRLTSIRFVWKVSLEVWHLIISPAINLPVSIQSYFSTIFLSLSLLFYFPLQKLESRVHGSHGNFWKNSPCWQTWCQF